MSPLTDKPSPRLTDLPGAGISNMMQSEGTPLIKAESDLADDLVSQNFTSDLSGFVGFPVLLPDIMIH